MHTCQSSLPASPVLSLRSSLRPEHHSATAHKLNTTMLSTLRPTPLIHKKMRRNSSSLFITLTLDLDTPPEVTRHDPYRQPPRGTRYQPSVEAAGEEEPTRRPTSGSLASLTSSGYDSLKKKVHGGCSWLSVLPRWLCVVSLVCLFVLPLYLHILVSPLLWLKFSIPSLLFPLSSVSNLLVHLFLLFLSLSSFFTFTSVSFVIHSLYWS